MMAAKEGLALAKRPTCELCDAHGPDSPHPFGEAWLDFHRALHDLAWLLILGPIDLLLRKVLRG